jgi:two-component system cell cycle sensor histidine kinase/response regulator CckA
LDSRLKKTDKQFKLLIIDDEKKFLDTLFSFLTKKKYEVVSAFDGLEGIKILKTEQQGFDLVITDLVMPKMSGNYLISMIRKEFPHIPVIAMTGWDSYPDTFTNAAQADKVLEKPFRLSDLDKTIKELLPT